MIAKAGQDIRFQPLYTTSDICRYAHVLPATLQTWTGGKGRQVILQPLGQDVARFSFINLIEAHVLVALRKTHNVPMQRIRKAVRWMVKRFGVTHPLAEVDLETFGREIIVEHLGIKVAASAEGQLVIPQIVRLYLRRVERDAAGPVRFYPITTWHECPKLIVMDPRVDFGRPVIVGTRVETVMIRERFDGGESMEAIAKDYDIATRAVEEALRCENERRAA